jgi:hypothetical protein
MYEENNDEFYKENIINMIQELNCKKSICLIYNFIRSILKEEKARK